MLKRKGTHQYLRVNIEKGLLISKMSFKNIPQNERDGAEGRCNTYNIWIRSLTTGDDNFTLERARKRKKDQEMRTLHGALEMYLKMHQN